MNSPEVSIRDRYVQDIHLEKALTYYIDTNLKIFAESVHVLSKISEQILMQPSANAIIMTAYNSSKSAYGQVTLSNNFFSQIDGTLDDIQQNEDGDVVCRIATRSALHIFKNVTSKSLALPSFDSCQIELDPKADYAIIHLKQQFGAIQRAFILPMKEHTTSATCENIFMERQRLKNQITSQPKMILNQFAGLDCREVKFVVTPTEFSAHRYIIREEFSKVRKTEVTIPVDHFELYHIHLNTKIVISLKELRSVLYFADSCGMVVTLHFDRPGRPFIVAVEDTLEFKAQFVLATLDETEPLTLTQQCAPSQTPQIRQLITPSIRNQMPRQSRIVQETPPQQQLQQKQLSIKQRIDMNQEYSGTEENENRSPTRSPTHSALF